jgi:hypothetical protein
VHETATTARASGPTAPSATLRGMAVKPCGQCAAAARVQLGLGDHGAERWIAVFYEGGGGQEPVTAAGVAQEATPWRAVQSAAWAAVWRASDGS